MNEKGKLTFHWYYILAPIIIFSLSLLMMGYFCPQLPAGELATHFDLKGTPNGWSSPGGTLAWMMGLQLLFVLLAGGVTCGITKMRILPGHSGKPLFSPGDLLSFMGNLFGLPQSILCFAMFDIFWYAVYQSHLMPMWLFVVIVLVLAGLIPLILAILALSKRKRAA